MKKRKPKHPYTVPEIIPSYYHHSSYPLEIRKSTLVNAGLGLFSLGTIPSNCRIDYYTGDYLSIPTSAYYIEITNTIGIDAGSYPRCYMAMINDGFSKNNCRFEIDVDTKQVSVWTLREIQTEELFVSYGDEYWHTS